MQFPSHFSWPAFLYRELCPEPSVTLLARDNSAITAAMTLMLAIGTAGIEAANSCFWNVKLKANMLICLINTTLESMQQWGWAVSVTMLLSGARGRKTHYCMKAIQSPARCPRGRWWDTCPGLGLGETTSAFCRRLWMAVLAQWGAKNRPFEIWYFAVECNQSSLHI